MKGTRGRGDVGDVRNSRRENVQRATLFFCLYFPRLRASPLSVASISIFMDARERILEYPFIFVTDSSRKERLSVLFSLVSLPPKKEKRNRSLGSLFIEIMFRNYECRNAREQSLFPVYVYMYMKICALLSFYRFSCPPSPFPFPRYRSHPLIILQHHHVLIANRLTLISLLTYLLERTSSA